MTLTQLYVACRQVHQFQRSAVRGDDDARRVNERHVKNVITVTDELQTKTSQNVITVTDELQTKT